jgi:sulfite reductase (NADPH) hemoprotein beta-component
VDTTTASPDSIKYSRQIDVTAKNLNQILKIDRENIDERAILSELDPLFERYAAERTGDERFGDFLVRNGVVSPPASKHIPLELYA